MADGNDIGEGTGTNTGPHPITSPFDWGLGSARVPDDAVPPTPAASADPASADPASADPATELMPAVPVPAVPVPAPPTGAPPVRQPEPYFSSDSDDDVDTVSPIDSPIDSLFGETQFTVYQGERMDPLPTGLNLFDGASAGAADGTSAGAAPPTSADPSIVAGPATPVAAVPREPRAPFSKNQKLLIWLAGGVIALLVLAILFVIGMKSAPAPAPAPVAAAESATPKVSPSPSATPTSSANGPAAAGVQLWSDLRGGECVDPYSNPFALKFTVVDCVAPHPAQMVFRGTFSGESTMAYPGLDSLQSQINLLCTAPGVIDLATAGAYRDIQFQASYAATTEEWTNGQHDYFCFVKRAGGGPITGSVAGTPAK